MNQIDKGQVLSHPSLIFSDLLLKSNFLTLKIHNYHRQEVKEAPTQKTISGYRLKPCPSFFDLLNTRFDIALLFLLAKYTKHKNLEYFQEKLTTSPSKATFEVIEIKREDILEQIKDSVSYYSRRTGECPTLVLVGNKQCRELNESAYLPRFVQFSMGYASNIEFFKQIFDVDILVIPDIDGVVVIGSREMSDIRRKLRGKI